MFYRGIANKGAGSDFHGRANFASGIILGLWGIHHALGVLGGVDA